jgi:hypothetical protein
MILRYTLAWIPMVFIAIVNGIIRQTVYGPLMSELRAHQLSTLTGILLLGLYLWILSRWWPIERASQAFLIGGIWLVLTIGFEFGFGHFVMGHPWAKLLRDYDLRQGRVWSLFLLWVLLAPYVVNQVWNATD